MSNALACLPNSHDRRVAPIGAASTDVSIKTPNVSRRIPSLDGLRGASLIVVFLAHLSGTHGAPAVFDYFDRIGGFGVKSFFIISGFLITTLLIKEKESAGRINLGSFFYRRALRIFPALYCYIGVIVFLQQVGYINLRENDLLHAVTYTMNYHDLRAWELNHVWSLAVEEQFYLIWPCLVYLLGARGALIYAVAAIIVSPICRWGMWYELGASPTAMTRRFQAVADSLAIGCLMAGCYNFLGARKKYIAILSSRFFLLIPGSVFLFALASASFSRGLYYTVGQSFCNVALALCIDRYVRLPCTRGGRLLNSRPLVAIGVLSYSLYLWQEPFLNPMDESHFYAGFPQNIVLAICMGIASYYFVERPFLRFKDRRAHRNMPE